MIVASEWMFRRGSVQLVNTSRERDLERLDLPFDLSLARLVDRQLPKGVVTFEHIRGSSSSLMRAKERAAYVAQFDVTVLLLGARGTGKELFAKAIHDASQRTSKQFFAINCSAIPEALFESELFGAKKGGFTGATEDIIGAVEKAGGGTLFLDEIGHMPIAQQPKLLRFLEDHTYCRVGDSEERHGDVRIIAATNRDLNEAADKGDFLLDLLDRIEDYPITIPSLRARLGDLPELVRMFLDEANAEFGAVDGHFHPKQFTDGAIERLKEYPWPGKVRMLRKTVRRLILENPHEEQITAKAIESQLGEPASWAGTPLERLSPRSFMTMLAAVWDELLERYARAEGLPDGVGKVLPDDQPDLKGHLIQPLLYGRSLYLRKDVGEAAGKMFKSGRLEISEGRPEHRFIVTYREKLSRWIDNNAVERLQKGE